MAFSGKQIGRSYGTFARPLPCYPRVDPDRISGLRNYIVCSYEASIGPTRKRQLDVITFLNIFNY